MCTIICKVYRLIFVVHPIFYFLFIYFIDASVFTSFHYAFLLYTAAVRRTFSTASEADIDGVTRKFFSNARDRDGGRARRTSSGKSI